MALEITRFWWCDWHAARDLDKATEYVETGLDPDPGVPAGWLRIQIDRVQDNPDFSDEVERRRAAARDLFLSEADPENPPKEEEILAHVGATLLFNPPDVSPIEVETLEASLCPEKASWVCLLGIPGYGGDPARVFHVAAEALPTPSLPSSDDLLEVLMQDLPEEHIDQVRTNLTTALDVIRASLPTLNATDLENAIQHALDTTEPESDPIITTT